ncbi:hypothetical protein JEZ13_00755 [bacterium]|nr:hypothetical protein [bacterium]
MKIKILIIIVFLFCYPLLSQEQYLGYRIVTWEEINGYDYVVLSDEGEFLVIEVNGETVIIRNM